MKRSWTITVKNVETLYLLRILVFIPESTSVIVARSIKYLYFPPIQCSGPNILSLSLCVDPNHQFRGACANKSTSAPGPCQLRGAMKIFPRLPPPPGPVSVLFLARRAETSSVVNIDQLLTETAHDPRDLCPVTPEDHGYTTAHNGNGLSYNRKIICLSSSLLFSAQSLPSPQSLRWRFVLAVSEINDVFPFNCGAQDAVIWLQSVLLGPTSGRNWTLLGNNFILFRIVQNSQFIAMWWHFPGTWWNRC